MWVLWYHSCINRICSLHCDTAPYPKTPEFSLIQEQERSFTKKYSSDIQYKENCLCKIRVNYYTSISDLTSNSMKEKSDVTYELHQLHRSSTRFFYALSIQNFSAYLGWLTQFKQWHGSKLKKKPNSKEIYNAYETCLVQKHTSTRALAFQCEYTITHVGTDQVRNNYCDVMCPVVPVLHDHIKLDYV